MIELDEISGQLTRGAVEPKHPYHWCVLSTVSVQQQAESRTVVLRRFEDHQIFIYTDSRSGKCHDIRIHPHVSLLFFDPRKQLQIRACGTALIDTTSPLVSEIWSNMREEKRQDYQTQEAPGTLLPETGNFTDCGLGLANFAILSVAVDRYDVLQLNREGHQRQRIERKADRWVRQQLVP